MYEAGSFAATQVGFDEAAARHEASRCFRCDAVYRCGTVDVVKGRGPERSAPQLTASTEAIPVNASEVQP